MNSIMIKILVIIRIQISSLSIYLFIHLFYFCSQKFIYNDERIFQPVYPCLIIVMQQYLMSCW